MGCRQGDDRSNIVFLLGMLQEVLVLTFFDVTVVDDDDLGATLNLGTEFSVVLLLDFYKRVGLLSV